MCCNRTWVSAECALLLFKKKIAKPNLIASTNCLYRQNKHSFKQLGWLFLTSYFSCHFFSSICKHNWPMVVTGNFWDILGACSDWILELWLSPWSFAIVHLLCFCLLAKVSLQKGSHHSLEDILRQQVKNISTLVLSSPLPLYNKRQNWHVGRQFFMAWFYQVSHKQNG